MTAQEFLIDKRNHSDGVVVSDYRLQGMNGVELCKHLGQELSAFPVILISSHIDTPKVIAAGVSDLVLKPATVESLQDAITRATDGEEFTDRELHLSFRRVTMRELEIAAMIADGKSSREIAAELGTSTKNIEAHRARIMDKTRADDAGELVRMWRAWMELVGN